MTGLLSRSVEDYLKAIYQLSAKGGVAGTTEIAQRLELSPASVTGMVKKLAESGHVEHVPYRGVRLTEHGRSAALGVMRRHRIIETYLREKLRYDWSTVHAEAERLEHAASDELIDRMEFALGQPKYDPHGAPIPTRDGQIEQSDCPSLAAVEIGRRVSIREVDDDEPERLRYLQSLGLVPGVELVVADRQPFGGPTMVRIGGEGGEERVMGTELARCVLVTLL